LDNVIEIHESKPNNVQITHSDTYYVQVRDQNNQFSTPFSWPNDEFPSSYDWIRVSADFPIDQE